VIPNATEVKSEDLETETPTTQDSKLAQALQNIEDEALATALQRQYGIEIYEARIPPSVSPGQVFRLRIRGRMVEVVCPPDVVPGQKIRFQVPLYGGGDDENISCGGNDNGSTEDGGPLNFLFCAS